jgi:hypothetical protein
MVPSTLISYNFLLGVPTNPVVAVVWSTREKHLYLQEHVWFLDIALHCDCRGAIFGVLAKVDEKRRCSRVSGGF